MAVLTGGKVALCGRERLNDYVSSTLSVHEITNGKELRRREIKNWAGGLASVTLGGIPCLALSFKELSFPTG